MSATRRARRARGAWRVASAPPAPKGAAVLRAAGRVGVGRGAKGANTQILFRAAAAAAVLCCVATPSDASWPRPSGLSLPDAEQAALRPEWPFHGRMLDATTGRRGSTRQHHTHPSPGGGAGVGAQHHQHQRRRHHHHHHHHHPRPNGAVSSAAGGSGSVWNTLPDLVANYAAHSGGDDQQRLVSFFLRGAVAAEGGVGVGGGSAATPARASDDGLRKWGDPCTEDAQCLSGMCADSCSAEVGSCVCPCSDTGEDESPNGPWNGQWPVARCCCATVNRGDLCVADDTLSTRVRNAAGNFRKKSRTPIPGTPPPVAPSAPGGAKPFGEVCRHFSECASGICATGCDCDNARLLLPQSCSCNCPTPVVPPEVDAPLTCGGFLVGKDPCIQHCPPCPAEVCSDLTLYGCQFRCLSGDAVGQCSDYAPFFLNAGRRCGSCCNLNMCPLEVGDSFLRRVHAAATYWPAAAVFLSGRQTPWLSSYRDFREQCLRIVGVGEEGGRDGEDGGSGGGGVPLVRGVAVSRSGLNSDREDFWTRDVGET